MVMEISCVFCNYSTGGISRWGMFSPCQAWVCALLAVANTQRSLAFITCLLLFVPNALLSVHFHWNLLGPRWWLGALLLSVMTSP